MYIDQKPLEKLSTQIDSKRQAICGEKNHRWKGGRFKKHGYVFVLVRGHPLVNAKGYVREHRIVMEQFFGRYIPHGLDVHHINGIKDDNRIENLELLTHAEHASIETKKDTTGWRCSQCGGKTRFIKPTSRYPSGRHAWHYRKGHKYDTLQLLCDCCYNRDWRLNGANKKGMTPPMTVTPTCSDNP